MGESKDTAPRHLTFFRRYIKFVCSENLVGGLELMHTGLISVPWPVWRRERIDRWLLATGGATFRRQSKLLDALPYAAKHDDFPDIFVSTCGS